METTAVVAIVGVLAATALPRMTALAGEARYAALNNAQAAISTVATMSHAKFLINGRSAQSFEDSTVALVHGYPAAAQATAEAAGLARSHVVYTQAAAAGAGTPPVYPGSITLVPKDIAGTARAADCFLVYEQATATRPVPRISLGGNASPESCA